MTTNKFQKLQTETVKQLQSGDLEQVNEALREIRENGNTAYLPVLFELLAANSRESIRQAIYGLLAELKQREAVPLLVEAIQDPHYAGFRVPIVSACWENGLDYSFYLSVFVDLVIQKDFRLAFEAYTVITNMNGKITRDCLERESKKLKEALPHAGNRTELLQDLLNFLPELQA